ncbi:MAG: PepSY-like domain-containing protein [Rikenellaceae bacterium]
MRKITTLFFTLFFTFIACISCNNDSDYTPPSGVEKSFDSNFPNATDIYWVNYDYYQLAIFNQENGNSTTAYFNYSGLLLLTGASITVSEVPDSVVSAFQSSLYSSWDVDAIGQLDRYNMETLYVYTVTNGSQTFMLYFDSTGDITMQLNGGPAVNTASNTPYELIVFIRSAYYGCLIVDTRYLVGGNVEVEILHINKVKTVVFNSSLNWDYTYWQLVEESVSDTILNAVSSSEYSDYTISQIFYYQATGDSDYYQFVLTKELMADVTLKVSALGQVID